jgi:hypothetical protein
MQSAPLYQDTSTETPDFAKLDEFLAFIKSTAEHISSQGRDDMSCRFSVIHGDITAMRNLVRDGFISEDHARREIIKLMNYCLRDLLPLVK